MRLIFLSLTITLLNIFAPVLAASGDVFIVYRPNEQGQYPSKSHEKWLENPPVIGVNVPANCIVEKFIQTGSDTNLDHYKRTSTGIVCDPPKIEEPVILPETTDAKIVRVLKEKAADSELSDTEWLKLFRASKSEDVQKKEEALQEIDSKKMDGGQPLIRHSPILKL